MTLYALQKFLYEINRDPRVQAEYAADRAAATAGCDLDDEERSALTEPDIGKLYVLGVNGQILMHFAALHRMEWDDYLQAMRDGIAEHGPVRAGVYAMTGYPGVDAGPAAASGATSGPADDPRLAVGGAFTAAEDA